MVKTNFEKGIETLLKIEAGHSLYNCQICKIGMKKCKFAQIREKRESKMEILCRQGIKRTSSCRNLHIENECLEYPGQYCWNYCWSNCNCWTCNPAENPNSRTHSSVEICEKHQKELEKNE